MVKLKRGVVGVLCGLGLAVGAAVPAAAVPAGAVPGAGVPAAGVTPALTPAGGVRASTRSGGVFASAPAAITAISCVASCASVDAAQPGSVLRIAGMNLADLREVTFIGGAGNADNTIARVLRAAGNSADVVVPAYASSGRLRAVKADGSRSEPSRVVVSIASKAVSTDALQLRVVGQRVFAAAFRPARIDLLARQPMSVVVALVRTADGAVVMGSPVSALVPGAVRSVTWDGKLGGVLQPAGRYEFRVFSAGAAAQAAQAAQAAAPLASGAFDLVDHKFPVRGKHDFGTAIAAFGAARNGHIHQGQDIFAPCGTPIVAARGGVVKVNAEEANAGNYLVIDGEGGKLDYAYMHMREPSALLAGTRVFTGQLIGYVGDTGDAVGCHLHFELWSGQWQAGGAPIDPLPALQGWDSYS
ncbi:MAG: peptidoglycan LD-endopeptidase LytH [Solirubrobacteraceae bacterium]|nr:peptidoglycan LD-endopeptidase LytH [Solirubrobacteraceae bacterium]